MCRGVLRSLWGAADPSKRHPGPSQESESPLPFLFSLRTACCTSRQDDTSAVPHAAEAREAERLEAVKEGTWGADPTLGLNKT